MIVITGLRAGYMNDNVYLAVQIINSARKASSIIAIVVVDAFVIAVLVVFCSQASSSSSIIAVDVFVDRFIRIYHT